MKRKTNLRINQYNTLESGNDIVEFGGIRLQELTTGRDVKEEIADRKTASHTTRARLLPYYMGAGQRQTGTHLIILTTRT